MRLITSIKQYILKFFKKELDDSYRQGYYAYAETLRGDRLTFQHMQKESLLGKNIIGISNENQNLCIGVVVDFMPSDVSVIPIVYCYIRKTRMTIMGKYLGYSPQALHALLKLTPKERVTLMFDYMGLGHEVEFNEGSAHIEKIMEPEDIIQAIKDSGVEV